MSERWFDPQELEQLSRPTMDRAIEAIDAGDLDRARKLCTDMKREWLMLHDLMAESVLGLVTYIQDELGDEGVKAAWEMNTEKGWRRHHDAIQNLDRREARVPARGHVAGPFRQRRRRTPGSVLDHRGRREDHLQHEPLRVWASGSCARALYESQGYGTTHEAHDWSYGRKHFPLYCTHCTFMNEKMPIEWSGYPLYPSDPPEDYNTDPCVWYWYKDVDAIPERHWARYGAVKPEPSPTP